MAEPFFIDAVEYCFSRRRKTISLEVREGQVQVRAPWGYPKAALRRLVQQKRLWIEQKLQCQREQLRQRPSYRYECGERFPYMGGWLTLAVDRGSRQQCRTRGDELWVSISGRSAKAAEQQVYEQVQQWYRQRALAVLTDKTQVLCRQMGLHCRSIRVRATRSKWGHCTSAGAIQYNWQIVLAPESVVDYLVAHEVSHLRHPNHSRAFWRLVADTCPGFESRRDWLREHGHTLILPPVRGHHGTAE